MEGHFKQQPQRTRQLSFESQLLRGHFAEKYLWGCPPNPACLSTQKPIPLAPFFGGGRGGWLSAQLFAFEKDGKLRPDRKKKRTSGVLMHLITPSRLLLLDSVRWRRRRKPHSPLKMDKGEEESPFLPNRLSKNK